MNGVDFPILRHVQRRQCLAKSVCLLYISFHLYGTIQTDLILHTKCKSKYRKKEKCIEYFIYIPRTKPMAIYKCNLNTGL